jgi:hypothetical protein
MREKKVATNSLKKQGKPTDPNKVEKPKSRSSDSDYTALIREAFEESDQFTPIMFLVTHAVYVEDQVKAFQISIAQSNPPKIFAFTCGLK